MHSLRDTVERVEASITIQIASDLNNGELDRFCASSTPWLINIVLRAPFKRWAAIDLDRLMFAKPPLNADGDVTSLF